jgi:hypothetical protein
MPINSSTGIIEETVLLNNASPNLYRRMESKPYKAFVKESSILAENCRLSLSSNHSPPPLETRAPDKKGGC